MLICNRGKNVKQNKITFGTVPKANPKNVERRGNIDTPNTHIYGKLISWLSAGTSIKGGVVRLVLYEPMSLL